MTPAAAGRAWPSPRATPTRIGAERDGPDARLDRFVAECETTGVARRLLLVRLSALPRALARPHHLRLVRTALEPLAGASRAQTFHLESGDIAIAWRGPEDSALTRTRRAIEHLFEDAAGPAELLALLRLPEDAAALRALLDAGAPAASAAAATAAQPLDPVALERLERGLAQADMARFVRRARVAGPDGAPLWERRFLAVADAVAAVISGIDAHGDAWLFRRLTRTLDRRMLALLSASAELHDAGPFAFELNVASLLGPQFLRFDALLPRRLRGQVTIDFAAADIVADLAAFGFARDFARDRAYRVGLRGLGPELAAALPAGQLGFDLAYVHPGASVWAEATLAELAPARVVLTGADDPAVRGWGVARGIGLFEGGV